MIRKIDHIGIAVKNIDERLPFWSQALGLTLAGLEKVASEGVEVAMLSAGPSRIELLEPLGDDTTVGRFLARRGEGIHHLTLEVDDLDTTLAELRAREVPLIGDAPRDGAGGSRVAFLHPRASGGVLVELVERPDRPSAEIAPGKAVLLYLRDPQEKLWGVLRKMDGAGVVLEGIDISSFDDWVAQIERGEESVVGPSVLFVPMIRLEKILLDRSSGHLPSLADRFKRRAGRSVQAVLDQPSGAPSDGGQ